MANIVIVENRSRFNRPLRACFDGLTNVLQKVRACVGTALEKGVEIIAELDRITLRLGPSFSITVESIHKGDRREAVLGVAQIARSLSALGGTISAAATVPALEESAVVVPSTAAFFWVFWSCNLILEGAAANSCRTIYKQEESERDHTLIERPLKRTFNDQFQRDLQQLLLFAGENSRVERELRKFLKKQEVSSYFLMGLYLAFTGVIFSQEMDPKIIFGATGANSLVKFLRYLGLSRHLRKIKALHQSRQIELVSHIPGEIDLRDTRSLSVLNGDIISPTPQPFSRSDASSPDDRKTPSPSPSEYSYSRASLPSPPLLAQFSSARSLPARVVEESGSFDLHQIAEIYRFGLILFPDPTRPEEV